MTDALIQARRKAAEFHLADKLGKLDADAVLIANEGRKLVLTSADHITPRRVRWLWADRLPMGSLCLLAGREGLGKSTIAADIAAKVTRGTLDGEYRREPRDVLIVATEDDWEFTIVPRLLAAKADLSRVHRVQVTTGEDAETGLLLVHDLTRLTDAIRQVKAAVVILDPLMSRLGDKLDTHRDSEVRTALEPLSRIAMDERCVMLGLIHVNKSGGTDASNSVMGSRAFTAVARSVLYAASNTMDESGQTFVCGVAKCNLGPRPPLDTYRIDPVMVGRDPDDRSEIVSSAVHWLDPMEQFTLAQILEGPKPKTAEELAAEWLVSYLASEGGRADSAACKSEGGRAGHSERTLKNARARAGIEVETVSTATGKKTVWYLASED